MDIDVCPINVFAERLSWWRRNSFSDASRDAKSFNINDGDVIPRKKSMDAIASTTLSWKNINFKILT